MPIDDENRQRCARKRRKYVAQALRAAYRRHVRDPLTRLAVKQALGA
jgi:hypothetical protein